MQKVHLAILTAIVVSTGAFALAESHADKQLAAAVKARQSHMQLFAFNLGALGAMAKQEAPYDAAAAQAAADNLLSLAMLSQAGYWLPGTDNASMENSAALPVVWAGDSDIGAKAGALVDAAKVMQVAAGTDLTALQGAMGAVGAGCSGCHKAFRAPSN